MENLTLTRYEINLSTFVALLSQVAVSRIIRTYLIPVASFRAKRRSIARGKVTFDRSR